MSIIEILKITVLGIIEGLTEWLPISSTGHMILIDELINFRATQEFKSMFLVVIQLGAILAVVLMYFNRLNPFSKNKKPAKQRATLILWSKIVIACLPAAILGILLDDFLDKYLYNGMVVAATLILYGILFIIIENRNRHKNPLINKTSQIDYHTALYIGFFQVLSLIPGTSRSGATIIGAMLLGCSRGVAAEFSFFLGIPVIFGASLLKIIKFGLNYSFTEIVYLLLGMIIAFLVSIYSINFLLGWIKKNDFKFFGYYRIVLGMIVLIYFAVNSLVVA